jgi:hypothetical protein
MLRFLDDQVELSEVDQSIYEARQWQTKTEFGPAVKLLQDAIERYPKNTRLREVLREIESGQEEARQHDLEVVRRKRLEADQNLDGPTIYQQINSAKKLADRYKDDQEFQKESSLLQTRLQTIASASTTSISSKITATRPAPVPIASQHRRAPSHWIWAAGLVVLLAIGAVGVFRRDRVIRSTASSVNKRPRRQPPAEASEGAAKPQGETKAKVEAQPDLTRNREVVPPPRSSTQAKYGDARRKRGTAGHCSNCTESGIFWGQQPQH